MKLVASYMVIFIHVLFPGKMGLAVDALALALKAGNARAVNTALMGALARQMNMPEDMMLETLSRIVPAKTIEVNRAAFRLGYEG